MFKNKPNSSKPNNRAPSKAAPPRQARPGTVGQNGADGAGFSWIGSDVKVTGNIVASNDIHLDGRLDGDISCNTLVQGEGSVINGAVKAKRARFAGKVEGKIDVDDLIIEESGRIKSDIDYCRLSIAEGALLEGQLRRKDKDEAKSSESGGQPEKAQGEAAAVVSPVKLAAAQPAE